MQLTKDSLQSMITEMVGSALTPAIEAMKESQEKYIKSLISSANAPRIITPEQAENEKGFMAAKIVRALAAGKGDPYRALKFVEKNWCKEGDGGKHDEIIKALSAGDGAGGGFMLQEDLSSEVIELLRPRASVRGAQPIVLPMSNGTATLPGLATGAQSNYSGENVNGGTSEPSFRDVKLTFKKLITLVPVSNDLLRYSTSNADMVVRDDLVNSMAQREDLAFIRGDGLQDTPIGMRNYVTAANTLTANATINLANVTTDLGSMVLALEAANVRMIRPTWFFAPRTKQYLMTVRDGNGNYAFRDEMMRGLFWGLPFKSTTQIPVNLGGASDESEVYLTDMADMIIGEALTLTLDASGEAAYHDGSTVQAAFSKDQTVIRAIAEHDFNTRHLESIAVLTGVKWSI